MKPACWSQRAYDGGYRDYSYLEPNPIFKQQMGSDPRYREIIDGMRRDIATQRERARQRGLLDLASLQAPH